MNGLFENVAVRSGGFRLLITVRPALPQREIRRLMQEAQQLYGLVVLDLALIRDEQERALVSRLARQQRAAKR